ncbi:MAG: cell division protein ZapB [Vicinamibacterales bacterium]
MAKTVARALDLEPIERLEEKVKALVDLIDRLRQEQRTAQDENARLKIELEGLQSRLADADHASAELTALREERDHVRSRVESILGQLEEIEA